MTICGWDDEKAISIQCDSFREAIQGGLIENSYEHPSIYLIGQYWLPLEFCPWCGNQI